MMQRWWNAQRMSKLGTGSKKISKEWEARMNTIRAGIVTSNEEKQDHHLIQEMFSFSFSLSLSGFAQCLLCKSLFKHEHLA